MATKSFTREIKISDPSALKKIDIAMKNDSTVNYKTPIRKIDIMQPLGRKSLANMLTNKF